MVGARVVVFPVMSCVRVVGVREREGSPLILSDTKLSHFLSRGNPGGVREQTDRGFSTGAVRGVEDRPKRAGCIITWTRVANAGEPGGGGGGAFEALPGLLAVHPLLPAT